MSLIYRIAYLAYARGTHHKLAFDALQQLNGADRSAWQTLFLKHGALYASGSKQPDDVFKDFKNHVLHPRDGYWGGAVEAARTWYETLVGHLKAQRWADAVTAAGVLSHYLSDPLQPFHTGQSEAETSIHRACEWSINRSYDRLYAEGMAAQPGFVRRLPRDANWLARVMCESADIANVHYEKLIAHYDITRGVADPPSGLDVVAQRLCATMLVTAVATIAAVLDHAFDEAGVKPPETSLTAAMLLATVAIPRNQFLKRVENSAERRQIQAIFDELQATGTVVHALPEENQVVRDLYAAEVITARPVVDVVRLFPRPTEGTPYALPAMGHASPSASARQPAGTAMAGPAAAITAPAAKANAELAVGDAVGTTAAVVAPKGRPDVLTTDADVVDAPSIGPKTAHRLAECGVKTIGDLLAADPSVLAGRLAQRHIMPATIIGWQDQARLVLEIPGLRGGAAQLLVGAGFRRRETVAAADGAALATAVQAYASSAEGQRLLRDGALPTGDKIADWQARARSAKAA